MHNRRLRSEKGEVSAHMEVARVVCAADSGPKTDLFAMLAYGPGA